MQTFLPYPSFIETAKCLDYRRLGKQRVEAWQILETIEKGGRWENHPVVNMWEDYPESLSHYGSIMCIEWKNRGYEDNMYERFQLNTNFLAIATYHPPWINNPKFLLSHQSNLVRKFPTHYRKFFPDVPDNLPYYWPIV